MPKCIQPLDESAERRCDYRRSDVAEAFVPVVDAAGVVVEEATCPPDCFRVSVDVTSQQGRVGITTVSRITSQPVTATQHVGAHVTYDTQTGSQQTGSQQTGS